MSHPTECYIHFMVRNHVTGEVTGSGMWTSSEHVLDIAKTIHSTGALMSITVALAGLQWGVGWVWDKWDERKVVTGS